MPRATLSLACLWWLTLVSTAFAQPSLNANDPGFASLQNFSGGVALGGTYFQVQNVAGNGVGWKNGFSQFGVFSPYWVNDDFVVAVNGRMLITDNQQIGGNFGGIGRYYAEDWDRILGANIYYDLDQSSYKNNYRQVGFGLETLGQWWDFRANGYVPTASGTHFEEAVGLGQDPFFYENRIGFLGYGLYEQSLFGGDFEFGIPVTPVTPWLRAYSGMYFYRGNGHGVDPVGFRGRLEGSISNDLSLGMMVSHDKQWGTNLNVVVNFQFSGWQATRWFPNLSTRDRMLTQVQRNWRIATDTYTQKLNIPAYNPRTDLPYFVTWVDNSNTNPGPGTGTFEDPLKALPASSPPADLILVRVGNTTEAAPLTGSIQLTDYQRMLGEGREHQFDAYANFGAFHVPLQTFSLPDPGFQNTGNYPYLSSLGNAVTLANNNEVSAFNFVNAAGAGIISGPGGTHNFNLNYLNFLNNTGGGIMLQNASGAGLINNVTAYDNTAGGISVATNNAGLQLTMQDIVSNSTFAGAQLFGVNIAANGPTTANLTNVTANGNQDGIILTETNSSLQAVLSNVTATGNVNNGLTASGTGGSLDLTLDTVDTSSNGGRGIYVTGNGTQVVFSETNLTDDSNGGDNINFTLSNSSSLMGGLDGITFDNSVAGSGIVLATDTSSTIGTLANPFVIQNVSANGNGLNGLQLSAINASTQYVNVVDSHFDGNGVDGINQFEAGGSTIVLNVDPTTLTGNTRDGYHVELSGGSTAVSTFTDDTLDTNGRNGIYGEVDLVGTGNSIFNLNLTNSTGQQNNANGLFIRSNNGAAVTVNSTDGNFSNNGQTIPGSSGVRFDATDSVVTLNLTNTPAQNTAAYSGGTQAFGLQLNLNNTIFTGSVTDGNFSNNLNTGVLANVSNFSTASLSLDNAPTDGNGQDGLKATVTGGSSLDLTATGTTSFSNNGQSGTGNGLNLAVSGAGSSLTATLTDTSVNSNQDHGLLATATAGSSLSVTASGTTSFDSNGADGANVTVNASNFLADFTNTSLSQNTGAGFNFSSTGATAASTILFTNVIGDQNGLQGVNLLVDNSSVLDGSVNGGSFSNNGQVAASDGVQVLVDHNGQAIICFDGTHVDNNTDNGFEFTARNGGALYTLLQSSGNFGTLSAANNTNQAVVFDIGPGSSGGLFTSGQLDFTGNGGSTPVSFIASGTAGNHIGQAVFNYTGTSDNNAGDGLYVQMDYVDDAYIDIQAGSLSGNGGNGANIQLTNDVFGSSALSVLFLQSATPFSANPFNISNMTINNNGLAGINIDATNVIMPTGTIYSNDVTGNGTSVTSDGILLDVKGASILADFRIGSDSVTGSGNTFNTNSGNGINVQVQDTSQIGLTIQGNTVVGNNSNNIVVNLVDNSVAAFHIDNNTVTGQDVSQGSVIVTTGVNFTGTTLNNALDQFIPPDTMGAVGPNNVVEMLNGAFAIYDKTGSLISRVSLDQFWINSGIAGASGLFDSRIIYNPTVGRWFATSIDGNSGNSIYVAVSATDDPTGAWQSVSFQGDTAGLRFNDFDTLGIDADALTIATNNFGGPSGFDVSVYTIPLTDLLAATPTLTNMVRFENLNSSPYGSSIQAVVNFGPSDGVTSLLSSPESGSSLGWNTISNPGTSSATLGTPSSISVASFTTPTGGSQPGGAPDVENDTARFGSNVVEVNGSIWAAHAIDNGSGQSIIRWYEIDQATQNVLQSGDISSSGLDLYYPSIAVNSSGTVMIGYSGSGAGQFISSMASVGQTTSGVTTFNAPQVLQAGASTYDVDFGSGRNRWGDYSSTVVDPTDPSVFWTFQERVVSQNVWGVQITQLSTNFVVPVTGTTAGDGIQVTASDNAHILAGATIDANTVTNHGTGNGIITSFNNNAIVSGLSINGNTASDNGLEGIHFNLNDSAVAGVIHIDGNTASNNGQNGILAVAASGTTLAGLSVDGPGDVSNNGASGINVQLNPTNNVVGVAGLPVISIDGTAAGRTVNDNGSIGINFVANNSPLTSLTIDNNTVDPNQGDGIHVVLNNSATPLVNINKNSIGQNVGDGVELDLTNSAITTLNMLSNLIGSNEGQGINLIANTSAITTLNIEDSSINNNQGNGVNLNLTGSPITNLNITGNNVGVSQQIGLGFLISGDTFSQPFSIQNTSASGIDITDFSLDLTPLPGGQFHFDTDSPPVQHVSAFTPFAPANGTEATTGLVTVNGTVSPNWAIADEAQIMDATFNNFNPGESFQWNVDLDQTFGGDESVFGNELIGATVSVDFSNGGSLTGALFAVPGDPNASQFQATGGTLVSAGISGNQGDGVHIVQNNSNITNVVIDNNIIDSNLLNGANTGNGINFASVTNSAIGSGSMVVTNNEISHNAGDGIRLIDPGLPAGSKTINITQFNNNTIDSNTGNGVDFQFSHGQTLNIGAMFGNDVSSNGGMGLLLSVGGTGANAAHYVANIGDSTQNANTFDANLNAGVGISMSGDSTGGLVVANSSFINTLTDSSNANFTGQGLAIHMIDSASLAPATIGDAALSNTSFNSNAGDGFSLFVNSNAQVPSITLQNITANSNEGDGLSFSRNGSSSILSATILNAEVTENTLNGIEITAGSQNTLDTYLISASNISNNGGRGLLMNLIADSDLDVTVNNGSVIDGNTLSGIEATVNADVTDTPTLTLLVDGSSVSSNGTESVQADGIRIFNDVSGSPGSNEDYNVTVTNSTINSNTRDGMNFRLNGTSLISGNDISFNGDDGIDIRADSTRSVTAVIDDSTARNVIQGNGSDGIQLVVSGGALGASGNFTVNGNDILDNEARGISLITAAGSDLTGDASTTADIENNWIARNGLEAIYVVNTSSQTQADVANVDNLASDAMFADGNLHTTPHTDLTVNNNLIDSNGGTLNSGNFIGASGLVIQVGTSDGFGLGQNGDLAFSDDGGFANSGRGGVVAAVTDNTFTGQYGSDVTFNPFISIDTANLSTAAGIWDNGTPDFQVTTYEQDPLARLDLTFTGNTGDGNFATNILASNAFYNDADPVFKSRDTTQTNAGPFGAGGTRNRNATHLASRSGAFTAPIPNFIGTTGQNSANFLYPGVGASTFRVQGGAAFANNGGGGGNSFTIGGFDFSSSVPIGGGVGVLPFSWGSF